MEKTRKLKNDKLIEAFYIFILILPFLDLISSVMRRTTGLTISLGMLVKGLVLVGGAIYILLASKSKYRRPSLIFFVGCAIYTICYLIFKPGLLSGNFLMAEINYLVKFFFFPTMFFVLLNLFDEYGFDKPRVDKLMIMSIVVYIILIVIPTIFKLNFNSYENDYAGSVGWFYSANEISTILLLLYPFIYELLTDRKILLAIIFFASLYMISLIGTKVTMFGIIIISILLVISTCFYKKRNDKRNILYTLVMLAIVVLVMTTNYSAMNLKSALSTTEQEEIDKISEIIEEDAKNDETVAFLKSTLSPLLSHRDVYAINTWTMYRDSFSWDYVLFGMGFSNTERIDNPYVVKLVEIDPIDMAFHMGLGAIILWLTPFVYTLVIFVKKKSRITVEVFFHTMTILLTVGISSLAGHVYMAPAVSIYVSLYFAYLFYSFDGLKRCPQNLKNKITFLNLHLGMGGIESATINNANALSKKYDVEIISFYKMKNDRSHLLSNKVKVTYLYDGEPNREELKNALAKKQFFQIVKEGCKAAKILFLKKYLVIEAIKKSNSKVLVSTRWDFSILLSKYKTEDAIAIAQEHHHHNDDRKYINVLKTKYLNIDYLFALTTTLATDYRKFLRDHNNHTEVVVVPNMLTTTSPKEKSRLTRPNLISVGRLDEGKRIDEMLDIFSRIRNEKAHLYIIGDGDERLKLENKVKTLNLTDRVVFTGYLNFEEQKKYYLDSSIFLMTSISEGLPMVLLEAGLYGLPSIAYETSSGVSDIIIDGQTGYIIPNRNEDEFVQKIDELLKDKRKLHELSKNTKSSLKRFEEKTVLAKWNDTIGKHLKK